MFDLPDASIAEPNQSFFIIISYKWRYRDQLAQALARKDNEQAQVTNALIEHCEDDIKALYRELYGLVRQCPSLEQGGDNGNDGE